jgi:preprotein translocase subunit YajC
VRIDACGGVEVEPAGFSRLYVRVLRGFFVYTAAGRRGPSSEVVVHVILANSTWAMQPEASTTAAPGAAPSGDTGGAPSGLAAAQPFLMIAVMFAIFYFLLFRPQQKRQRELDDLVKSLKKGDKVRLADGIRGEVVELTETEALVQIADKVKVYVLRSSIAARIDKPTTDSKSEEAKPAAG